jgi:DNA primase
MLHRLEKYKRIYCYLDNDQAGIHSTNEILKRYGSKISDQSTHYKDYKDVNDFLCGKKLLEKVSLFQNKLPENKLITKQEGEQVQEGEQIQTKKLTKRMKL